MAVAVSQMTGQAYVEMTVAVLQMKRHPVKLSASPTRGYAHHRVDWDPVN